MTGDPIAAMLLQLSEHAEQLSALDEREAEHFRAIQQRLGELADLITALGGTLDDQSVILARLDRLAPGPEASAYEDSPGGNGVGLEPFYEPSPAPRWWKLAGQAREEALDKLRGWVEQVYGPGYGQLAATLGGCWDQHPLCLYGLDVLSELWSVLYLQAERSPAVVSAQAEFQARIVPAIAEQLMAETTHCGHAQARWPVTGTSRSLP
jgi:hypothetical protein